MRKASIDIGSNSILLLIAELEGDGITPIAEQFYAPRLGKGLAESGRIDSEAADRAEADLLRALEVCRQHDVEEVHACATAALREAQNGNEFAVRIYETLGVEISVLSASEEARLSYIGATASLREAGKIAVFDVGGASTECTVGESGEVVKSHSIPLGALNFSEKYGRSPGKVREAMAELYTKLAPLTALVSGHKLIGVGGSITTLASVRLALEQYDSAKISGLELTHSDIEDLIKTICTRELEEVQRLPGMDAGRADIIEAGATIVQAFMAAIGSRNIVVCPWGIRFGILFESRARG